MEALGLVPPWPRPVGPCPEALFEQLERELRDVTVAGEYIAAATAFQILCLAARGEASAGAGLADACARLVEERLADPRLSVGLLAAGLRVHRSRLSRVFRAAKGLPPAEYIRLRRLAKAQSMLAAPGHRIAEVARACGFDDPAYFSRRVRAATGANPRTLRRTV